MKNKNTTTHTGEVNEARLKDRAFLIMSEDDGSPDVRLAFIPIGGRLPPVHSAQHVHATVVGYRVVVEGYVFVVKELPSTIPNGWKVLDNGNKTRIIGFICVAYPHNMEEAGAMSSWRTCARLDTNAAMPISTTMMDASVEANDGDGVFRAYLLSLGV